MPTVEEARERLKTQLLKAKQQKAARNNPRIRLYWQRRNTKRSNQKKPGTQEKGKAGKCYYLG